MPEKCRYAPWYRIAKCTPPVCKSMLAGGLSSSPRKLLEIAQRAAEAAKEFAPSFASRGTATFSAHNDPARRLSSGSTHWQPVQLSKVAAAETHFINRGDIGAIS